MISYDPKYQHTMGSDTGPNFIDILNINTHYGCLAKCPTNNCLNGGYPNPNDCTQCICQEGYTGSLCNLRPPGFPAACGATVSVDSYFLLEFLGNTNLATTYWRCCRWLRDSNPSYAIQRLLVAHNFSSQYSNSNPSILGWNTMC